MPTEDCILLFDSIHYVLGAERLLKESGIPVDLIPTPKELSSDCGMSVSIPLPDLDAARRVLGRSFQGLRGIYLCAAGTCRRLDLNDDPGARAPDRAPDGERDGRT